LGKQLALERIFEYNRGMQLGDSLATAREPRSPADEILDKLNDNFTELLTAIDSGALDHLEAAEKIALWQKFETFRHTPAHRSPDDRRRRSQ
jgi:hypothetical protein